MSHYRIEAIRKEHDRRGFDCGTPFLNDYLRQFVRQNHNNGIARAFVMVPSEAGNPVVGYYTLTASSQSFDSLPPQLRRGLPKYPVPVALIGELAVDRTMQGQGLATALLVSALRRIALASEAVGVWAVVVDPLDQQAVNFYRHHGFEPLVDGDTLFLTMKDATDWLASIDA